MKYRKPGQWLEAYDCQLKQEILFRLSNHALPADNPQQAETASHNGVKGNHNCQYDKLGGSAEYKETDDGYHAQFLVSCFGFLCNVHWQPH